MTRFEQELNGTLGEFWKKDALKKIANAESDIESGRMIIDDLGVATWKSNGHCIMDDMAEVVEHSKYADIFDRKATKDMRAIENEKFFKQYRESMKNHKPSEEEMFEMRATFGRGTKVVDVITGETITL